MALRRFTLRAAAGFRGREGGEAFARELLACFSGEASAARDGHAASSDTSRDERPAGGDAPVFSHRFDVVDDGKKTTRTVAAHWPGRRVLVEVVDRDALLDPAWQSLHRACLQMPEEPQYVVLTNQRDVRLYDLSKDRQAARLAISLDELPKYSEAFVFFEPDWKPGTTPKIINVDKVSKEVADLVAKVFRALAAKHPTRRDDVTRFILQCIVAMFSEDIGLLPKEYFTTLLYRAGEEGDAEGKLAALFAAMSTPDDARSGSGAALARESGIPFFNGGLFKTPVTVPLDPVSLRALTKAAEANWTFVDPHIFGSVFQGILDDAERHASGAHYTAREDILSVVGPTIVEPWRERIAAATTLTDLRAILTDLGKYRVLDPACGSGNFLYVAFRELYKLETEVLCRIYEFASAQKSQPSWASNVRTKNFFGIDINPFAVELAKTTLNIAKKIAFEERKATVLELYDQGFLEVDPSLPLDNLDENVVCADALFTEWPEVDAIVGNPPFLGDRKIRGELGGDYLRKLQSTFDIEGTVDFCCYWFRRAHQRLRTNGRAGLVGTSGIRIGKAQEASLGHITRNGGLIVDAISSQPWPGDANTDVSIVNWIKGATTRQPRLVTADGQVVRPVTIAPHLQLHRDMSDASSLQANAAGTAMGVIFGSDAFDLPPKLVDGAVRAGCARPVLTGTSLLTGRCESDLQAALMFTDCSSEAEAHRLFPQGLQHLRTHLLPMITERASAGSSTHHYARWLRAWWEPREPSTKFFSGLSRAHRAIACSSPQSRPIFVFYSTRFVPTNTLQLFSFDDDYSFGIIQSSCHWDWTKANGGRVRADFRYTSKVWKTFPWPQDPSESDVLAVADAARALRATRRRLMAENGWSLRALYQSAEVAGPHPLKDAQAALDAAVDQAYGRPSGQEATEFLLELNLALAEDEAAGITIQGPGLPSSVDPKDPRFTSTDCIEPPPFPTADGSEARDDDAEEEAASGERARASKSTKSGNTKTRGTQSATAKTSKTSTRRSSKGGATERGDDG
jgi:type I restriction-modification system DNA methylase subunit